MGICLFCFSPEECNKIINLVLDSPDKYSLYNGYIMTADGKSQVLDNEIRRSKITLLPVNDDDCNWIFGRVIAAINQLNVDYFNFKVDRLECLQFSEYMDNDGGFYVKHKDEFYCSGMNRKLSFSIQLSDPESYEGGDLLLHCNTTPDRALREHGSITIFPSYTLHEVTPVTKGTRYSLVGWVLGPKFV
jgi:Uncharacterized iron-regulated protein